MRLNYAAWCVRLLEEDKIPLPSGHVLQNQDRMWEIDCHFEGPNTTELLVLINKQEQKKVELQLFPDGVIYGIVFLVRGGEWWWDYRSLSFGPNEYRFFRSGSLGAKIWKGPSGSIEKRVFYDEFGYVTKTDKVTLG